jgi:hypothetical protein
LLDVGETGVDVTLVPSDGITRVTVQILDSLEPLNVLDAETTDAPFPDPFTTSFTGLATTTTYWARIYQRIVVDSVVQYARFCAPVEFTTGEPYVPPTSYEYEVKLGVAEGDTCGAEPTQVFSSSAVFGTAMTLFLDSDLTIPVSVFNFVSYSDTIYNLTDNIVGSTTGNTC